MATGGRKELVWDLNKVGVVTLEDVNRDPFYKPFLRDIVLSRDVIVTIDYYECEVQLYRLHDGKFLCRSSKLESHPNAVCVMTEIEICIILDNGLITIMSIDSTDMSHCLITTRKLNVQGVLDVCHGIARFKDNLVVSGIKQDTISWCTVSLDDGHVSIIHQICKAFDGGSYSSVTTKDNKIYISCDAGAKSPNNGVYGYDILNPNQYKYIYKHQDLDFPSGITINQDGFIFVCNFGGDNDCIYQLTDTCQLVSIFRVGITCLYGLFCEHGNGHLYVTCCGSNIITIFRTEYEASAGPMPVLSPSDTDRFMRIAYLLVDVGSRVLRHLMSHHTVTPTSSLDQYLANNRNTINNLLKRKVLNISQMDILFPPNGGNTILDEYDITLLSALFNNIVPSLSQQEKNMIQALREERNKLYGHAKSCKMNAHDYQTCWNSISSTLVTLSQQSGNPDFENEVVLEFQHTQVSAIPAGSYLDILKSWFSRIDTFGGTLQDLISRVDALESKKPADESEEKKQMTV